MGDEEWAAIDKSMRAIDGSMERLSKALSDMGGILSGCPDGKHTKNGTTVKVQRRNSIVPRDSIWRYWPVLIIPISIGAIVWWQQFSPNAQQCFARGGNSTTIEGGCLKITRENIP